MVEKASIAVLPFLHISDDIKNEHFTVGLADAVSNLIAEEIVQILSLKIERK